MVSGISLQINESLEPLAGSGVGTRTNGGVRIPTGDAGAVGRHLEQHNVLGTPTGVRIAVAQGEVLPAAPRGFTWRRVEANGSIPLTPVDRTRRPRVPRRVPHHHRAAAASSASRASTQVAPPSANSSLLPERRLGLQPVDQEGGGIQCRLAMRRGGQHQHDVLARGQPADAVDHRAAEQLPAPLGFLGDARDGRSVIAG